MIWLDRIGITLQFLAFWLAVPELLGDRIRRIDRFMRRVLEITLAIPVAVAVIALIWTVLFLDLTAEYGHTFRFLTMGAVTLPIGFLAVFAIRRHVLDHIAADDADHSGLKRRLLVAGAFCYSIGYILQLAATIRP
jgi:hypothetical protein